MQTTIYDESVDYDVLEQHTYADSGNHYFLYLSSMWQ